MSQEDKWQEIQERILSGDKYTIAYINQSDSLLIGNEVQEIPYYIKELASLWASGKRIGEKKHKKASSEDYIKDYGKNLFD